jgi:hypothetical protein
LSQEFLEAYNQCTQDQQRFINARRLVGTDQEAANDSGIRYGNLPQWKRNKPHFKTAWLLVKDEWRKSQPEAVPEVQVTKWSSSAPAVVGTDRQTTMATEIDRITYQLPALIDTNIHVALNAEKDADKLRALQMLYEVLGFNAGEAMPVSKQNKVFVQMLTMLAPQVAAEAERRGLPSNTSLMSIVEAQFEQVESEGEGNEEENVS